MRAFSMLEASSNLLLRRLTQDTDPQSKLAIGIGHLSFLAGFMATQIWAANLAKNTTIYSSVSVGFYQVAAR